MFRQRYVIVELSVAERKVGVDTVRTMKPHDIAQDFSLIE